MIVTAELILPQIAIAALTDQFIYCPIKAHQIYLGATDDADLLVYQASVKSMKAPAHHTELVGQMEVELELAPYDGRSRSLSQWLSP